jgi:hypothetical protein
MRASVAVATVQGKAYFLIVNELKQRNIPFVSLIPGENIPARIRVVITTSNEIARVVHSKIIAFDIQTEPNILGREIFRLLLGKEAYDNVIIGIDPGEVIGVAVLADGVIVEKGNCYCVEETVGMIMGALRVVDISRTSVRVKIGSGVPLYRRFLEALDEVLPKNVDLEVVGESGTNSSSKEYKHRRGFRHISYAIRIAEMLG